MNSTVRTVVCTACLLALIGFTLSGAYGQTPPRHGIRLIGFGTKFPPGDLIACRQAIAHALDREAIGKATAPHLRLPPFPATRLQHPLLPAYDPVGPAGYKYDPARAKELYAQCGFSGSIPILVRRSGEFQRKEAEAVAESLRNTLGAQITWNEVSNFSALVQAAKNGNAPVWIFGIEAGPEDTSPGFPMFIGKELTTDLEVKAMVERGDARGVEEMILQKTLIVPIIYY